MLKRLFSAMFLLSLFSILLVPARGFAVELTIIDQPVSPVQPPIILTQFGGGMPDFFEFYNQSTSPVLLQDWRINFSIQGTDIATGQITEQAYSIQLPAGWLLPKQYHTLQRGTESQLNVSSYQTDTALQNPILKKIVLVEENETKQYNVEPSPGLKAEQWAQHKQRMNASLKVSGVFTTDYAVKSGALNGFSDALYNPPNTTQLQIVEILPNARSCSPTDASLDCNDYIKLYNPTSAFIDASTYRLRTDSGGTKSSATNTFTLATIIAPGGYAMVTARDNGEAISITNNGGYAWLEDAYGVQVYRETMVAYPDASIAAGKGNSWALDTKDTTWKWMMPAPNQVNYWPPEATGKGSESVAALADCGPGKERNPETNRCRNIVSTDGSSLTLCKAGQERNPDTNRCRSVSVASSSLKPCDTGQIRNSTTNRCKAVASASTLTPCKAGQERNPETNRCRKAALTSKDLSAVKDVESSTKANMKGWWLTGAAILVAMAYGVYEWRQDIAQRFAKIKKPTRYS